MDSARWERAQEIFFAALDEREERRNAFVDEACGDDAELRREVEILLDGHGGTDFFLDRPLLAEDEKTTEAQPFSKGRRDGAGDGDGDRAGDGRDDPDRLGPYRLLELLGRGGMGEVYRAVRADDYRQEVAIKLLSGHGSEPAEETEGAIRFRAERQILAGLHHANIARLLDGGTAPDGRPYLVMELVAGRPIDRYAAEEKLGVEARLELFRKVCAAVAFAHRNLIVHRDLKPGNILVDESGEPKLLDFGIAKLLDKTAIEETMLETAPGRSPLTLAYASPEQIRGQPVTTATDVYALGVLLFLLLTGRHPRTLSEGPIELARSISEDEPTRPSKIVRDGKVRDGKVRAEDSAPRWQALPSLVPPGDRLARRLEGDLDTIVLTALHSDAERRYDSVDRLALDIERHLEGLPVSAREDTFFYRGGKFIRRHKTGVATTVAAFLLLVAGITTLLAQRQATLVQKTRAEQISGFLVELFERADPERARGEDLRVRDLLDQGARDIERLRDQPEAQADLLETMARAYRGLGLYERALELLDRALELRLAAVGEGHRAVAENEQLRGAVLLDLRRLEEAREHLERSIAIDESLGELAEAARGRFLLATVLHHQERLDEAERTHRRALELGRAHDLDAGELASGLNALATLVRERGRPNEAVLLHRRALELLAEVPRPDADVASYRRNLGIVLMQTGELDEAEAELRGALAMQRELYGETHPNIATSLLNLGELLRRRGAAEQAAEAAGEALEIRRRAFGESHASVAEALNLLANLAFDGGELELAEERHRDALEIRRRSGNDQSSVAESLANLANVLQATGRLDEASNLFEQALEIYRRLYGGRHEKVAIAAQNLAGIRRLEGRTSDAVELYRDAVDVLRQLDPEHPDLAPTLYNAAIALRRIDRPIEAEAAFAEALERTRRQLGEQHPLFCRISGSLGALRAVEGRLDSAAEVARDALPGCQASFGPDDLRTAMIHRILGYVHLEAGEHAAAEAPLRAAYEIYRAADPSSGDTETSRRRLVRLYRESDRPHEAAALEAGGG